MVLVTFVVVVLVRIGTDDDEDAACDPVSAISVVFSVLVVSVFFRFVADPASGGSWVTVVFSEATKVCFGSSGGRPRFLPDEKARNTPST